MAKSSASIQKLVSVFVLLITTFIIPVFSKSPQYVAKLIHRDSIYYSSNLSSQERAIREVNSSIARFSNLLAYPKNGRRVGSSAFQFSVIDDRDDGVFFANLSFGNPPQSQLLLLNTASNYLWFQCETCINCFEQSFPIFSPFESTSYLQLKCSDPDCFSAKCDKDYRCIYDFAGHDGTTSHGTVGLENLRLDDSTSMPIPIGCGHDNASPAAGGFSGVLGLGPDSILIPHFNRKFGYCVGDFDSPDYSSENNLLFLGSNEEYTGVTSPLELYNGLYYLSLEGISFGDKWLNINPNVFKRLATGEGGVFIDSGLTMSFFHPAVYEKISEEVAKYVQTGAANQATCYSGVIEDIKEFPNVIFYFTGGANLVLDKNSMFIQKNPQIYCLTFLPNRLNNAASVIGMRAQRSHLVSYTQDTISFLKINCKNIQVKG